MFMGESPAPDRKGCWLLVIRNRTGAGVWVGGWMGAAGPDVPAEDLDGQTFPHFNLKSPTSLMNGWLHMLQSASLLFFVMCCQLMTSVGSGHRGRGGGGSWMEVCMWDILDLLNDCFFVVFLRFWLECPEFKRFVYSLLTWKSFRWL